VVSAPETASALDDLWYAGFGEEIAEAVMAGSRNVAIIHVKRIVTEQGEPRQLQNSGFGPWHLAGGSALSLMTFGAI